MKRKLTYTMLASIIPLACYLLVVDVCGQASDATHIAFTSERDGNAEIYIVNTNGKNLQNLTNHPATDHMPAFSLDGQWMAYVSNQDGNSRIYLMNRNNNVIRPLTNHLASRIDRDPDWSPDGQWIAFTFVKGNGPTSNQIYKINVNNGDLQQLTDEGYNRFPAWSPDGEQIAFYSSRDAGADMFVMKANGKNVRRVRQRRLGGGTPTWSPDGKQIAYDLLDPAGQGIYIMTAEGQNNRKLTPANTWSDNPAWSPNGHWIAYELEVENPWGNLNRDSNIHLISPDGIETRQLTEHPASDRYPAWVPASFLSVSPKANTQTTTLWGRLKQTVHD